MKLNSQITISLPLNITFFNTFITYNIPTSFPITFLTKKTYKTIKKTHQNNKKNINQLTKYTIIKLFPYKIIKYTI